MRGAVRLRRPRPRRVVRLAAVAAAALLAGLLPGTSSSASGKADGVSLAYTCQFGAGQDPQDISVGFQQAYPAVGAVGKPIQPGDLTLTVGIPRAAVTELIPAEADTLSGSTDMKANVTQGASNTVVIWPDLTAKAVPVAGGGDLDLVFTGKVPGVSVTAGGDLVFAAGDLDLTLHPQQAAGTPSDPPSDPGTPSSDPTTATDSGAGTGGSDGTADSPADAPAAGSGTPSDGATAGALSDVTGLCAAKAGQHITLATVPVPGAAGSTPSSGAASGATGSAGTPTGSAPSSASPSLSANGAPSTIVPLDTPPTSGRTTCDPPPKGDLDPSVLRPVPAGSFVLPMPGGPPMPDILLCGYFTGFSNVNKLNGAMIVNDSREKPALFTVDEARRIVNHPPYTDADSTLGVDLPPSHSTFLTYGFVPTTADVNLVSEGVMTVVDVSGLPEYDGDQRVTLATVSGYQDLRLSNVKINGVPLDVGSGCHTEKPLHIVLQGRGDGGSPDPSHIDGKPDYTIQTGGPLSDDDLVIPPFTGCGTHGENLDALFTSALSGPGNSLNFLQGPLCVATSGENCDDPDIPLPALPVRAGSTK